MQLTATAPLKPFWEISSRLYMAEAPAVTVVDVEPPLAAASPKSEALPARATAWGLPVALSVMESVPVQLPLAVGANLTAKEQVPPGATLLPHVLSSEKSPVIATFVIVSGPSPVLRKLTVSELLVVPTC